MKSLIIRFIEHNGQELFYMAVAIAIALWFLESGMQEEAKLIVGAIVALVIRKIGPLPPGGTSQ